MCERVCAKVYVASAAGATELSVHGPVLLSNSMAEVRVPILRDLTRILGVRQRHEARTLTALLQLSIMLGFARYVKRINNWH